MIKKAAVSMTALVLCLGMFSAASVTAQPTTGMSRQSGMSDMMKDMSGEMNRMTEQMGAANLHPGRKSK